MRYIYSITNQVNGKTYIGKRDCKNKDPVQDKYMSSSYILKGRKNYKSAFKKYGIENFKKKIILQGEMTDEEYNDAERYYIWLARSSGKAEYNIASGGDGGNTGVEPWNKGKKLPKSMRDQISQTCKQYCGEKHSQYGTHKSEECKEKLRQFFTGKSFLSEEARRKQKIRMSGEKNPAARKVICINTGLIFLTINDAAKFAGSGRSNISAAIARGGSSGKHPETKEKLYWRYYEN
jgi:group I intron endonuclease